jgi:hypothetical protein
MRHVCLLAALLVPLAAQAQITITSNSVVSQAKNEIHIGRTACQNNQPFNFTWDLGSGHPAIGETVAIVRARDSSTCSTTTVNSPDQRATFNTTQEQNNSTANAVDLILDTDAGLPNGCNNTTVTSSSPWTTHYCVQLVPTLGGTAQFGDLPIKFAMIDPKAPVGVAVEGGDSHLRINWQPGDGTEDIESYDVHVTEPDAGLVAGKVASHVSNQTTADPTTTDDGTDLVNDHTYEVRVVANDTYDNASQPSDPVPGTPKHVLDFYNNYRAKGGTALGGNGCSSAGAFGWIAGLALGAALLARRRTRKGGLLMLGLALLAPAARADWHAPDRPPRRVLVAVKIDRYDPKIDSEAAFQALPTEQRPYFEIFHGRAPLRWQAEVDWEVWHPFGSLMLGVTAGFWQNFGHGLLASTGQPSGDTALLNIVPLGVVATYRFDWLADRYIRFPFVPYAQIGYSRALWISYSGTGAVSKDTQNGGRGSGWTSGYTTAVGLALTLDSIDPELAREAYLDVGIQRTSIFAEYGWTRLDGFKSDGVLILTDRAWRFGMSVEF